MNLFLAMVLGACGNLGTGASATPTVCALDPPILVTAGDSMSASIRNPADSPCIATLHFGDPAFLPITWIFEPIVCEGATVVSFNVPRDAPNGEALVEWQCAGTERPVLICNDVLITGGLGNIDFGALEQVGTVGCVSTSFQTTSTVLTLTTSGSTIIETIPTTITSARTSFATTSALANTDSAASTFVSASASTNSARDTVDEPSGITTATTTWTGETSTLSTVVALTTTSEANTLMNPATTVDSCSQSSMGA